MTKQKESGSSSSANGTSSNIHFWQEALWFVVNVLVILENQKQAERIPPVLEFWLLKLIWSVSTNSV